jgi:membrane protein implicated in regulation of membrane protease activity
MNAQSTQSPRGEVVDELSTWGVGWGMIIMVLAPLSIPILALTAVALLPLLVPVLAIGLLAGVVYLPIALIRRLRRRRSRLGRRDAAEEQVLGGVEVATLHR